MIKLVAIESPLAGDFVRHRRYALWCMYDSLMKGEAPYASHLIYTQMLDDELEIERDIGIKAGFSWATKAELRAAYIDLGISPGMQLGLEKAKELGQPIEHRKLPADLLASFEAGEAPKATLDFG